MLQQLQCQMCDGRQCDSRGSVEVGCDQQQVSHLRAYSTPDLVYPVQLMFQKPQGQNQLRVHVLLELHVFGSRQSASCRSQTKRFLQVTDSMLPITSCHTKTYLILSSLEAPATV